MIEGIIITGLISGGVYALLAVGFSLIFGAARIINLAHTASLLGLNLPLSIVLSIAAVTIIGVLTYKLVIDRVRGHETTALIATLALAIIIQEIMLLPWTFGGHFLRVPDLVSGYTTILGIRVTFQYILTFGMVLIILLGTWALLMKTRLGIAIRSTAQDREVANLMGINVARTGMITMAISVALAAVAGALVAPLAILSPHMWMNPLVMIMAIIVLGGLGSVKGSLVGAFILGFAETLVVFLAPSGSFLKGAVALAIMLAVILIRPEGLFGVAFEEER